MIVIDDKIISEEVIKEEFVCNLAACKGACCWEGDFGAPLEQKEIELLSEELPAILPYLSIEGKRKIKEVGVFVKYKKEEIDGTPLLVNEACAFMKLDDQGIAQCGIELAHLDGKTRFRKPVSCHLYPVRITEYEGYDAVNYDRWEICNEACSLGEKLKVPVYQFVKDGLIRKYGGEFFEALEGAAEVYTREKQP